jgi:hypothetical protein
MFDRVNACHQMDGNILMFTKKISLSPTPVPGPLTKITGALLIVLLSSMWATTYGEEKENDEINYKKPVFYTLSFMAVGYGSLVLSEQLEEPSVDSFKIAFTRGPKLDDDSFLFNYVFHPLWGSETYLRAREGNFEIIGSIAFSMAASAAWEFLIESWSQPPSTQDLIFTTGIGWIIGEARYRLKQISEPEYHWLIDPINTTLEHIRIAFTRDKKGRRRHVISLAWNF